MTHKALIQTPLSSLVKIAALSVVRTDLSATFTTVAVPDLKSRVEVSSKVVGKKTGATVQQVDES